MNRLLLISAVIVMLGIPQLGFGDAQEEFRKTIASKNVKTVEIHNINGSIDVTSWNNDYIEINALKKTKKDRDELNRVKIEITEGTNLIIETLVSREGERGFFQRILSGANSPKVSVEYDIKLPGNVSLENSSNVNGDIRVSNISGNPELKTVNGDIKAENVRNGFQGRSTNGSIHAIGNNGGIDAKTTNGSIDLTIADGRTDANTVNGSVKITFTKQGINDVDLGTVNGSINLIFPNEIDADVDIKTLNGSIKVNNVQVILVRPSSKHLTAKIGKGGNTVKARSVNGNISLSK